MAVKPAYTPYDGSATPFTIGLSQLDVSQWIEPDSDLDFYLDEKKRVLEVHYDHVFRAEETSKASQEEVLSLLVDHLISEHPDIYRLDGNVMHMSRHKVDLADASTPALLRAGLLIQDDMVLMHRRETGWHLSAAFVAFPSSWSLAEKFGQPLEGIHAQVPGFEGGSRNNGLINRMFDNLTETRMVARLNWSIKGSGHLPQPVSKHVADDPAAAGADAFNNFIRVERQTLRRLAGTSDILFTVRVYVDPFAAIAERPDAAALFGNMADLLENMTPEQLAYKGLTATREPLCAFLRDRAAEPA